MASDVILKRTGLPSDRGDSVYDVNLFLTEAQLQAELEKCEYCEDKPCMEACPCDCSPADFILASEVGSPSDIGRSAALIMGKNPLGGVCGQVCPDKHCMAACVHKKLDGAVNIPTVQATIIEKAKRLDVMPVMEAVESNGRKAAVIGAGPAGLAAATTLGRKGYAVTMFEKDSAPGGMCNLIPDFRLDKEVLKTDIEWNLGLGDIRIRPNKEITEPTELLSAGFDVVIVAVGLWMPISLGIPNEDRAIAGIPYLKSPEAYEVRGSVAVIGGGATAFDCAMTALTRHADRVELFALEKLSEMPLSKLEMTELTRSGIDVNGRIRVTEILCEAGTVSGVATQKVELPPDTVFRPDAVRPICGSEGVRSGFQNVIIAIGGRCTLPRAEHPGVFYAGDCASGPTTVVEASAAGKNVAEQADAYLQGAEIPEFERNTNGFLKSRVEISGYNFRPVPLEADFFGRTLGSPFLLSAAPTTDGFDQMKKAYEAGWPGGIMKTSFDNVPIHIPAEYMFAFGDATFANCDNVSDHTLDRVCHEVEELIRMYPDRLTMASTGGPVTGDDESDKCVWQSNTRKLENAGATAIEYSLSCPQGGDGTEGDIASQNADLSAKIIDWVLAAGDGSIPKLFKLTGAVTSIAAVVSVIKQVFSRHQDKKAGITLANTFPTLVFRPGNKREWEEGVIVGMGGEGVLNISYLSLAKAAPLGVEISGNGGPVNYKHAADFLALGCKTVQFCSLVTKSGYGIIDELSSGLSHLLAERGLRSVRQLIGLALPEPITDFMALSSVKRISKVDPEVCLQCGNCKRCPYLAISYDDDGYPMTDAAKCIGCGMCNLLCFTRALSMRDRTPEETQMLSEA
jgi:NADPH-dependent glutamate synthase beta subunit-like oxidoreductase/dihydroorotate dehydrogenase/Pyruvate/2-oxoacid:ferredoxin oxidoreductase delta subunit